LAALRNFSIAKQFRDNRSTIMSLDFDSKGTRLITTSKDESLHIYDTDAGVRRQVLYSKKYGCNLARFTRHAGSIVYASTKVNDEIRYMSLETNQYIRYFAGHTSNVISMSLCSTNSLVSGDVDGCVYLWDLNVPKPVGSLNVQARAVVDCDGHGLTVAAVNGESGELSLFDVRQLGKGAFGSARLDIYGQQIDSLQVMPPSGDRLIVTMDDGSHSIVDAFSLQPMLRLNAPRSSAKQPVQQRCTVTPDGNAVIAGCADGSIVMWEIAGMEERGGSTDVSCVWGGLHDDGAVNVCAFNPHLMMCATASESLAFW
ncbi:WD40 repeat-like protein, partial [Linderina pennispora]